MTDPAPSYTNNSFSVDPEEKVPLIEMENAGKCCCKNVNFNFNMIKVMTVPKIIYNLYFRCL
jgi:hypothetical protein